MVGYWRVVSLNVDLIESIDNAKQLMVEGRDVPWLLDQWATRTPDNTFLIWEPFSGDSQSWTYGEFARDVAALAGSLHARGVRLGDRILVHLDNSPEFMLSWFACAEIGAVAVSTNTHSVLRDMSYFAEHAEVTAAITSPSFAALLHEAAPDIAFLAITSTDAGEPAEVPEGIDYVAFDELVRGTEVFPGRSVDHTANLGIQFTSGTTSRPKAVLWTHANAIWGAQVNVAHMRLEQSDVTLTFLPMFHTNAQSYSMLSTLWVGGTMVLQPKFSASRFWDVSIRHQITWCSLIPFCIKALFSYEIPEGHSYRFWGSGVRIPDVENAFRLRTIGWWGMTETITHGIVGDLDHSGEAMSIGRPASEYEISIRRPDGSAVESGERGELFIRGVRGVSLFKEYYRNPDATADSFDQDGWFATGDLIRVAANGDLFFSDRQKDMLKVGAENIAASEIEAVLMETGWVSECAVVGQKHFMLDEVPVAFVIARAHAPDALEEEIIAVCRRELADFKVVRSVFVVDELPRSTLEKISKNELRRRLPMIEE